MAQKIIDNKPYSLSIYWQKIIQHYSLISVLAKRELKVKYSRTFIGIGWVFLQPLVVVTVYTIFFKNLIKLNTEDIPYPQFVLTGLVLWYLFTGIIGKCTHALIESSDLIHKISFPRIIIIISKIIPVIIECLVLLVLAVLVVCFTHTAIGINAITVIFYFLQITVISLSIGLVCSLLVLKYRDFAHAIPFIINFGIWLTPVFYSAAIVPDEYKNLYRFGNPLALAMEGMRGGLFQDEGISLASWLMFIISCVLLFISFFIFVKFEKRIVENL